MTKSPSTAGLPAVHPGAYLRDDILPFHPARKKVEIAQALGITRMALDEILKGERSVTPATALKLGQLFGTSAETWLRLQAAYDLKIARDQLADQLAAIPRWQPEKAEAPGMTDFGA